MFMLMGVWTDEDAQANGWDSLEATDYAASIRDMEIHLPIALPGKTDAEERDTVEGTVGEYIVGGFVHNTLCYGEMEAIRDADGNVWVDYEKYVSTVL